MLMGFNIFSPFLGLGNQPHSPIHSSTRIESEEQVDYSGVSRSMGGLRSSTKEFDADYFMPHPSSVKTTHLILDELGSDERTQPSAFEMPKAPITLESSLPSPTPATSFFEDSFPIVIGAPTTS